MLPNMWPIPSFRQGWPNLKSICTPNPKIGFCHPRGCYEQTAKYMYRTSTSIYVFLHICLLVFLFKFTCISLHVYLHFSPRLWTEHGSVMFELMARWKVCGRVKILISESSPPLVQTEKERENQGVILKAVIPFSLHLGLSRLLVHNIW